MRTDGGTWHEDHGSVSTANREGGHGDDVSDDGEADVDHNKGVHDVITLWFQCEKMHMGERRSIVKTYVTDPCHTHVVASRKDIWRRTKEKGDDRTVSKSLNCPKIFVSIVISPLSRARTYQ